MRMPENWLEWLGVIGSVLTIISFGLYFIELLKRKKHETLMLGFLHGVKPLVEVMSARPTTTGADWEPLLRQVNDMLSRLQPRPNRMGVIVFLVCLLWATTVGFYIIARGANGNEAVVFDLLSVGFFIVAAISSLGAFITWADGDKKRLYDLLA